MARPSADNLRTIFRTAAKIKIYDETYRATMRAGKVGGMYYSPRGQELIPAAFAAILRPSDYVLTIYRGIHDQIAKGLSLRSISAEYFGKAAGSCRGKGGPMHLTDIDARLVLTTGVVGSGLPIAVGVGLSIQLHGADDVAVTNFGDGASNIGAFHEALNLASLWKVPVVFVCQNNQYAEYTPFAAGTAVARVSDRAAAYSMAGVHVDGNDADAMFEAASEAVGRARSGGGPTLIEAVTYRFHGHAANDSMSYMPKEELEAARAADPVQRLRNRLIADGICTEDEVAGIEAELISEVRDAIDFAVEAAPPSADELATDVYAGSMA
jgi:TPP-dependent pyruvate/acetoin dehydrogenase alpha subunit